MKSTYIEFVEDIFGLKEEKNDNPNLADELLELILETYKNAKAAKDYATVDIIRARAKAEGFDSNERQA